MDEDTGDILTTKYNIDGGETQTISDTVITSGVFTINKINVGSLAEGRHNLNIWCEDDKGGSSIVTIIPFNVPKTAQQ